MSIKRYAANRLLVQEGEVLHNAGVSVAEDGTIVDIFELGAEGHEQEGVEFLNGILTAGYINAHTHTELSFFDGVFVPGGSMVAFLRQIDSLRIDINQQIIDDALRECYATFEREGIVGYADISNEGDTVPFKAKQPMRSVSFVEMFGANRELADRAFKVGKEVLEKYRSGGVSNSYLTPHAPYSVSRELWAHLMPYLEEAPIMSLHFAETAQELDFMERGSGAMEHLYRAVWKREVNIPHMEDILGYVERFGKMGKLILLIHCVAMTREMMQRVKSVAPGASLVLCPASNLFIEGAMPNLPLMREEGMRIAIGTDSLSSSPSLSMVEQLRLLNTYYPEIPVVDLLGYATQSGAEACGFDGLGRIMKGSKPGLNLLQGPELLSENSLRGAKVRALANLERLL